MSAWQTPCLVANVAISGGKTAEQRASIENVGVETYTSYTWGRSGLAELAQLASMAAEEDVEVRICIPLEKVECP